jgi:hypothetical protein
MLMVTGSASPAEKRPRRLPNNPPGPRVRRLTVLCRENTHHHQPFRFALAVRSLSGREGGVTGVHCHQLEARGWGTHRDRTLSLVMPSGNLLVRLPRIRRCLTLGAGGVLPGRHIVSLLRVFEQFTHLISSGQILSSFETYSPL